MPDSKQNYRPCERGALDINSLVLGLGVGIAFGSLGFGIPCEPPSDEAKPGEVERALFEREARVAQRPVWLKSAGDIGEPGSPFLW